MIAPLFPDLIWWLWAPFTLDPSKVPPANPTWYGEPLIEAAEVPGPQSASLAMCAPNARTTVQPAIVAWQVP